MSLMNDKHAKSSEHIDWIMLSTDYLTIMWLRTDYLTIIQGIENDLTMSIEYFITGVHWLEQDGVSTEYITSLRGEWLREE